MVTWERWGLYNSLINSKIRHLQDVIRNGCKIKWTAHGSQYGCRVVGYGALWEPNQCFEVQCRTQSIMVYGVSLESDCCLKACSILPGLHSPAALVGSVKTEEWGMRSPHLLGWAGMSLTCASSYTAKLSPPAPNLSVDWSEIVSNSPLNSSWLPRSPDSTGSVLFLGWIEPVTALRTTGQITCRRK